MAKATLPTNYKDDIMASSMAGKRRYNMIQNSDGTISLEDVTNYTQVGSNFGAAQMNQTNTAVNNSADKSRIIDNLADVAANTQAGMMAGALAVRELNGNLKNFKSYERIDTNPDHTNTNYKSAIKYYLQESELVSDGMFVFKLTLQYGSTYVIYGFKHDKKYLACLIMSYGLDLPIYAYCRNGTWVFKNINAQ